MSYLAHKQADHGHIRFGNNAYDGFAYRANTIENANGSGESSRDPTRRFITEHNLALFWRRPGILPVVKGFPLPLLDTRIHGNSGLQNRPPGNIRFDCPPIRYRRRNLLAGQFVQENTNILRLWAVNDFSDHKLLLEYEMRIEETPSRKKLLHITEESEEGRRSVVKMKVPNETLQLKAMEGVEGKVFLRTKSSLQLAKPGKCSLSPVFNHFIHHFAQIPYMKDEIAIVDARGMLFWGKIGNPAQFSRAKAPQTILEISPTDCPRVLLSMSANELHEVDLREHHAHQNLLYSHSPLFGDGPFSEQAVAEVSSRDQFWHLNPLDVQLDTVLLTTTRQHILLDRRMPGIALLAMDHAEMQGADYCITVPAFTDPETESRIFSHYALTHVRKPAFSYWAVAYHPKEALWSSLGPKHELYSPRAIFNKFVRPHARPIDFDLADLPIHTRAIHYQPLHPSLPLSSSRALLFRQMEGGEIWYENIFFDALPKLAQNVTIDSVLEESGNYEGNYTMRAVSSDHFNDECLDRIRDYFQKKQANNIGDVFCYHEIDEELLADESPEVVSAPELLQNEEEELEQPNLLDPEMDPFAGLYQVDEPVMMTIGGRGEGADEEGDMQYELAGLTETIEEKKLFSSTINTIWDNTSALCKEMAIRQSHQIGIDVEPEEGEEEGEGIERTKGLLEEAEEEEEYRMKMEGLKIGIKGEMKSRKRRRRIDTEEEMEAGEGEWKGGEGGRERLKRRASGSGGDELEEEEATGSSEGKKVMAAKKTGGREEEEEEGGSDDEYDFEVDLDA